MDEYIRKEISVVYTSWNGSEPIPNGYDILPSDFNEPITFFLSHGWFETHLNDEYRPFDELRKFKVNLVDIKSVTDDHVHIYSLSHPNIGYSEFENNNLTFNKDVIEYTHSKKNFYVLFSLEHESDTEDGFLKFVNYLESVGFNTKKVILMNNNSLLYEYKKNNKKDIIVNKSYFLNFSATKVLSEPDAEIKFQPEKKGKFFISRNRTTKSHRKNLIFNIKLNNMDSDVNYSFLNYQEDSYNYDDYIEYNGKDVYESNIELAKEVNFLYKECDYEKDMKFIDSETKEFIHHDKFNPLFLIPEYPVAFENSYCNIITESCFEQKNVIHITEKSFRPFHNYQFPIFLATKGHVSKLKEDYNFDMFDDIINHSYDLEEDYVKRFKMVFDEIKRINDNKDFFIDFYKKNKFRFTLNKEKLHKFGLHCLSSDIDLFWNL